MRLLAARLIAIATAALIAGVALLFAALQNP